MHKSIITLALLGLAGVLSAAAFSAADAGQPQALPVDVDRVPAELFTQSLASSPGGQLLPVDNTTFWSKESLPGGTTGRYRVMSCVAPDSNILYVLGGQAPTAVATAYRYNILTNTWSTIAPMPAATANQMAAFWVDNGGGTDSSGIFICGRYNNTSPNYYRTNYRWRRATNTWDTIPWAPGPTGTNPSSIAGAMCAVVADSLYFLTRVNTTVCSLYRYSIRQGTWASIGQAPAFAYYGAMIGYGGKIWQIGSYPLSPALPTQLLCYNPPTRTWLTKASPSWADSAGGNSTHLVGIPGGKLVLYGGGEGWYPRRGINVYDTTANTWSPEQDRLPQPDLGGAYGAIDSAGTVGMHLACGEISYPTIINCNYHWRGRYVPPAPNDLKLDAIIAPTRFEQGVPVTPIVRIRNVGTAAQSSVPVYVTADSAGTTIYSANTTWTGTLNPGDTARVTFTTSFPVGSKGIQYRVTSWTDLAGDANRSNDTARFTSTVIGSPNRYFKLEWSWNSPRGASVSGCYGATGVQDSLVWVNLGYLAPFKTYILNFNTRTAVDSFTQYITTGSYGYFDMTYRPSENAVYAGGSVSNRMDKIDGTTKALISTYTLTGSPYNNWLLSMACDGDSLYSSYFNNYGLYKFSVTGTNARQYRAGAFPGLTVPFGLGYDDNKGTMYGFSGNYDGRIAQYDWPTVTSLLDTTLAGPGPAALFAGGEVFKDTFLLFAEQAPTLRLWCYRIIPQPLDYGVAAIVSPTGQVDTNTVVIPSARFQNYHASQSAPFQAFFFMENPSGTRVFSGNWTVTGLLPGDDTLLYFLPYNVGLDTGTWTVKCSTYVDGDVVPTNDVLTSTFRVVRTTQPPLPGGWTEIAQVPLSPSGKAVKDGGMIAFDRGANAHYVLKGYKTGDFYRYDPALDAWTTLPDMPLGVEAKAAYKGANIVSDGNGTFYATKGNNTTGFWKYTAVDSTWTQLADVPLGLSNKKVKGGTDLAYVDEGDSQYVYVLKGYKTEFYKYNVVSGAWYTLASAPIGVKEKYDKGSWLVYDEASRKLYAHKAKYMEMYTYSIDSAAWSGLIPGMPLANGQTGKNKKAKDGSDAAIMGGLLYALKGGNTIEFYAYDLAAGTWAEKETIPSIGTTGKKKRVKAGGGLTTDGTALYATKGNKTAEVWTYRIGGAYASQPVRSGVMAEKTVRASSFELGPNPLASGYATLRYSLPKSGPVSLRVFDVTGRAVLSRSLVAGRSGTASLDLRSLSAGIYLVKLESEGYSGTHKLVVQH